MTAADDVRAEAAARSCARAAARRGSSALPFDPAGVVMLAAGPDTPSAAIAHVKACWPDLWARIVAVARARGALPGAVMMELIEQALDGVDSG